MDLRHDIQKATALGWTDDNAKFFRLQGLSQAARDRKMNERKMRKPKNIHLVEEFNKDDDDYINDVMESEIKSTYDKHEISAAIREVNGGRDLSNQFLEESLLKHIKSITNLEEKISQTSGRTEHFETQSNATNVNNKSTKEKHKFFRNAAIMGLIATKQISLQDLINPQSSTREEDKLKLQDEIKHEYITDNDQLYQMESVPLREDPDIGVHPLQMGIDKTIFKEIDFTLSRLGKRIKVTPPEHFLGTTNDDSFAFVKRTGT